MPQAIHESTAFNSRNRKVAIHCVFSVKDNTHSCGGIVFDSVYIYKILQCNMCATDNVVVVLYL